MFVLEIKAVSPLHSRAGRTEGSSEKKPVYIICTVMENKIYINTYFFDCWKTVILPISYHFYAYNQGCGSGSGFLHGSGSGFQISLDPDPGPVSAQILEQKKNFRKVSKSDLTEENL